MHERHGSERNVVVVVADVEIRTRSLSCLAHTLLAAPTSALLPLHALKKLNVGIPPCPCDLFDVTDVTTLKVSFHAQILFRHSLKETMTLFICQSKDAVRYPMVFHFQKL